MLDCMKIGELQGGSETEWLPLTSREQSLIHLFRSMPDYEQKRVLRVTEALALSNTYVPVWSAAENI